MADAESLFEQAADVLRKALATVDPGQQAALLEEALRLNRLALQAQRRELQGADRPGPSGDDGAKSPK